MRIKLNKDLEETRKYLDIGTWDLFRYDGSEYIKVYCDIQDVFVDLRLCDGAFTPCIEDNDEVVLIKKDVNLTIE